jgi:hypothetical protein
MLLLNGENEIGAHFNCLNEQLSFLNRHDTNWLNNVVLISRGFKKLVFGGLIIRVIHRKTSGHSKTRIVVSFMSIYKSIKIMKISNINWWNGRTISVTLNCPNSTQSNKKQSDFRILKIQLSHRRLNQPPISLSFLQFPPIFLEYSKWKKLDN